MDSTKQVRLGGLVAILGGAIWALFFGWMATSQTGKADFNLSALSIVGLAPAQWRR